MSQVNTLKSLLTRTSIMVAQQRDLARRFEELENNIKTVINNLEDEEAERRRSHAA